jgi:hypothetical protein
MRPYAALAALTVLLLGPAARPAAAIVHPGDPGPAFTKNQLGGGAVSLSDYSGKVVILFLLGYG